MYTTLALLAVAELASAHFRVTTPTWRSDSLANAAYSQWSWPCAGVPYNDSTPRTEWPLTGGTFFINSSHAWEHVYINLGLGNNVSNWNISLTPQEFNKSGAGALCLPTVKLPVGLVQDGQNASLQFVTTGETGNALYNCAEIKFRANATLFPADRCKNDTGVTFTAIGSSTQPPASSNTTIPKSAAAGTSANNLVVSGAFALVMLVIFGSFL